MADDMADEDATAMARVTPPEQPGDANAAYAPVAPRYRRPWLDALLLALALLELLLLFPHNLGGDGASRFAALSQLLEGHGIPTIKYSLIGPLFSAPLWLVGKAISTRRHWWRATTGLSSRSACWRSICCCAM